MKQFVGKALTREVPFMDDKVEIKVLTVGDIRQIEAKTKEVQKQAGKSGDLDQLEILRFVLRLAVIGAEDMSDEDFDGFPVTELTSLSEAIVGTAPAGNE